MIKITQVYEIMMSHEGEFIKYIYLTPKQFQKLLKYKQKSDYDFLYPLDRDIILNVRMVKEVRGLRIQEALPNN